MSGGEKSVVLVVGKPRAESWCYQGLSQMSEAPMWTRPGGRRLHGLILAGNGAIRAPFRAPEFPTRTLETLLSTRWSTAVFATVDYVKRQGVRRRGWRETQATFDVARAKASLTIFVIVVQARTRKPSLRDRP